MKARKKVIWFTYFSSEELRKGIKLRKKLNSFAPWIPAGMNVFYDDPNYEIHVITPHYYIGGYRSFVDKNIHYHAFCQGVPFLGYGWPNWFALDRWTSFFNLKVQGIHILRKINPDIIHFWGAENTFASIFKGLNKEEIEKTIVSVQGFVLDNIAYKKNSVRLKLQNTILEKNRFFFTTCKWMDEKVLKLNPKAKFHPLIYPINLPGVDESIEKKYDLLFYARVTKSKGIEDLLEALKLIKVQGLELSLLVMGPCDNEYQSELKAKAEKLGVSQQISWAGFMETQEALYKKAQEAKIYVLPTHSEILAGTVRESMAMKLPVVTYSTGCLPMLNEDDENVVLVSTQNIDELATKIRDVSDDLEKQYKLKNKAFSFIRKINSNENFKKQLEAGYNSTLTHNNNKHVI